MLQHNGHVGACYRNVESKMWLQFFLNCRCARKPKLNDERRLMLLARAVTPVLACRNSRWPLNKTLNDHQHCLQRKMTSASLTVPRIPGEDPDVFLQTKE